jgi:hypothetical protein
MAQPGQPIMLSVWHRGQAKQVAVTGMPFPNFKQLQSDVVPDQARVAQAFAYGLGLHVIAITDADRLRFGLGNVQGVLIDRVDRGTQAEELGVQLGDVIQQIGDEICSTPEQAMTQLAYGKPDANDTLAILVQKPSGPQWVTVWVGRPDSRQFGDQRRVYGHSPSRPRRNRAPIAITSANHWRRRHWRSPMT